MKITVKKIVKPYKNVSTQSLQAVLRNHAHDRLRCISTKQLYDIMEELACRREESGRPFKSNEEAWGEFQAHYMPYDIQNKPLQNL